VAASLLLCIAYFDRTPEREPVLRDERAPSFFETNLALSPVGSVTVPSPGEPVLFRWRPVEEAAYYRLLVLDEEGRAVARAETEATEAAVEPADPIATGETYSWEIEVVMPDGSRYTSAFSEFTCTE